MGEPAGTRRKKRRKKKKRRRTQEERGETGGPTGDLGGTRRT